MTPRILAFAYACDPEEGSEPGAGWNWSQVLAGIGETWVLTRAHPPDVGDAWPSGLEPGAGYDRWLAELPERDRLHFVHVPIPWWDRFWWRRANRPSVTRFQRVEYLVWQWLAVRQSRRLLQERRFDLSWHLTWANAWLGSGLAAIDLPFVYGPVGGGVGSPLRLVRGMGARLFVSEVAREVVRTAFRYLNPLARRSISRAELILVQNPETRDWLPQRDRARAHVVPNAVVTDIERRRPRDTGRPRTALFAGRLVAWKGPSLAIRAMAELPDWRLILVGDGPEASRLQELADELGIADRIEFLGRLPRVEVLAVMRERADLLLFPSLHDDAGLVVAEAVATGLPVVCLDRGGPPVLGGIGVEPTTMRATVRRLAAATRAAPDEVVSDGVPSIASRRRELVRLLGEAGLLAAEPTERSSRPDVVGVGAPDA